MGGRLACHSGGQPKPGETRQRRPGLVIASRYGVVGQPEGVQQVDPDLVTRFGMTGEGDA